MISGQVRQIAFGQSIDPLEALRRLHSSELEQRAILGISKVERTGFGKLQEIGSEFILLLPNRLDLLSSHTQFDLTLQIIRVHHNLTTISPPVRDLPHDGLMPKHRNPFMRGQTILF
jgi:hypothetical protein